MNPLMSVGGTSSPNPARPDPAGVIDRMRYPIDEEGPGLDALLSATQAQLADDGCAVLSGFVRPDAIPALVAECDRVSPGAHRNFNETNVYFTKDHPELSESHPLRRFYPRSNAFVPADNFGADSVLRSIYEWPPFVSFIKRALGETSFYRYADPLADVIVNLAEPGPGFPWHFDTNNYTVTLAIQNAESGGAFEYSPNIRTATDENYAAVEAVLDNDRERIRTAPLAPGDLQIFRGRYSLHRVTPLGGTRRRYVAIFSFAETPDMVGSVERTRQLYGRVLPVHIERGQRRRDGLID
jgi:hypothetical protein